MDTEFKPWTHLQWNVLHTWSITRKQNQRRDSISRSLLPTPILIHIYHKSCVGVCLPVPEVFKFAIHKNKITNQYRNTNITISVADRAQKVFPTSFAVRLSNCPVGFGVDGLLFWHSMNQKVFVQIWDANSVKSITTAFSKTICCPVTHVFTLKV